MGMHTAESSAAHGLIRFLNNSPTPFHAVAEGITRLQGSGFVRLSEKESWRNALEVGGKYYVTRNQSSLIAFTVPSKYNPGNGFAIVGTHTDSPCFKIRPISRNDKLGYQGVSVETYGGGLWHSWLDRDLSIAGQVIVKSENSERYESHLIHLPGSLLRIPTLAIHLERTQNDKTAYNTETEMFPIMAIQDALNKRDEDNTIITSIPDAAGGHVVPPVKNHNPILLSLLSKELSMKLNKTVHNSSIYDFSLQLCDAQPSTIGGVLDDFIFSGRLDNLFSTYCAIQGLAEFAKNDLSSESENSTKGSMIACWDHEEIGSTSAYGAESNFLESVLHRIGEANISGASITDSSTIHQTIANSFLVSCDMAHAVHPGFESKHQANFKPVMNAGPVIKVNAKQRYATNASSAFLLRRVAAMANVPLQDYEIRNDMACGSTIGPLVSKIGLRTVDIGCAMLSMHSIRETAGSRDVELLIKLFKAFFTSYESIESESGALAIDIEM